MDSIYKPTPLIQVMGDDDRIRLINNVIHYNNETYYDINTFAKITMRSPDSIRHLTTDGNRIRVLKSIKIGSAIIIFASELVDFPFALGGRSKWVVRYTEKGKEYKEKMV